MDKQSKCYQMFLRSSQNNIKDEMVKWNREYLLSGSPGLVVMGGDSRSEGCGFESRRRILDGHDIFHIDLL